MPEQDETLRYQVPGRLKLVAGLIALMFLLVLACGLISRAIAARQLAAATTASAMQSVAVISPKAASAGQVLVLPGTVKAFAEAPIYAQVSGYLQSWTADIGTPVQAGQLLASISTPDLDQQVAQAQANLATATANEQIAAKTAARWDEMERQQAVSRQDADQKDADYAAAQATTQAARAALAGLQAQEAFKRIIAPFNGVVTARNTDVGALITTGSPSQTPLFTVDDESRLRIYVNVPQLYAAAMKHCSGASFTVPDYPGRIFHAVLDANANAIDPDSGTLLVQFLASNPDHALQPGDYAQVRITLPANPQTLTIPASALTFRDAGMEVASIGPNNRVTLKPVTISRDLGNIVEIATGLAATDRIINNPPDSLQQGDQVTPTPAAQP